LAPFTAHCVQFKTLDTHTDRYTHTCTCTYTHNVYRIYYLGCGELREREHAKESETHAREEVTIV